MTRSSALGTAGRDSRGATDWVRSLAWPTAVRASVAIGVPLTAATAAGYHEIGLMASTGAFTVLYGAGRAGRVRVRMLVVVALAFVACSAAGALSSGIPWAAILLLSLIGAVATFACQALRVGPPGAFFFVMVAGVAGFVPAQGAVDAGTMIAATAVGAAWAVPVALADLVLRPAGPQERAIATARAAVEEFLAQDRFAPSAAEASRTAGKALHDAWGVLEDGGDPTSRGSGARARVRELTEVHRRYATHLLPGSSPDPDLAADRAVAPLGVPSTWRMLQRGLRSPTVALDAAGRVTLGIFVSGLIALAFGTDHMYWAMMVAALVLHQGLDRRRSLIRAGHRLAGTLIGLGVFYVLDVLGPTEWATVAILTVLQGAIELAIPRNYGVAVTLITPLALTIATAGGDAAVVRTISERLLDTVIGLAVAVLVLLTQARGSAMPMVRAYVARVLDSCGTALDHIGAGTVTGEAGHAAQRELATDMHDLSVVATRARTDDPEGMVPWVEAREATAWLGLTVLARCARATGPADGVGGATWVSWSMAAAARAGRVPDPGTIHNVRAVIG